MACHDEKATLNICPLKYFIKLEKISNLQNLAPRDTKLFSGKLNEFQMCGYCIALSQFMIPFNQPIQCLVHLVL